MKLLTRIMVREAGLGASLILAALLGLITLGRLLQLRELFLVQGVGLGDLLRLFLYLIPFFLTVLVPAAAMLAVYLTVTRMHAEREIIALRAAGIGLFPLAVPVLVVCLVASLLTAWAGFWGVAWGMERFRNTVVELAKQQTLLRIQPGIFTQVGPGLTVYAREATADGTLEDVFVQDARQDQSITITAPRGWVGVDAEHSRLLLHMEAGRLLRTSGTSVSQVQFADYIVAVDLAAVVPGLRLGEISPKEMAWGDLWHMYRTSASVDANTARRIAIEIHKRPALVLACPLLGLTMFAVALLFADLGRKWGMVLGVGIFFVYYSLLSAGMSLAEGGVVPPFVGVWTATMMFALAGGLALVQASQMHWKTLPWPRRMV